MKVIRWFAAIGLASAGLAQTSPAPKAPVDQLIPWLLDEDQELHGVPFSELIFDTTGRKVLSFEANNAVDQRVAKAISAACDETMKRLNAPDSVIQKISRINEVSSHFEDTLRELLNSTPGLSCELSILPANAFFISTRNSTRPEPATAVSAHFISNPKRPLTKCAMTPCISL